MAMTATAIVPAAGKGERFGGAKLLAAIDGQTVLDRTLKCLFDAFIERVILVVPPGTDYSSARWANDPRLRIVVNPDPSRGMFSSIQEGLRDAAGDPLVVLPADMPFVSTSTVNAVINAAVLKKTLAIPVHQGRRGHPIAFPARYREAVVNTPPASTLKDALDATGAERYEIEVADPGILHDVDRPEDLTPPATP
jgi:molybdenum cofactor cytidylyltransferase